MNNNIDILEILDRSANEIRGLRQNAEANKLLMQNITIRQAIHQMRHGVIDYKNSDDVWDNLLKWVEAGRLCISASGDVYLDLRLLTKEVSDNAT